MKATMLHEDGQKTWALIFDKGDELIATLTEFAGRERMSAAHFTAIGAFSDVTLGYSTVSGRTTAGSRYGSKWRC